MRLSTHCRLSRNSSSNTKMPWFLLCLWWTFLLVAAVDCINLPSIHWNQSNPMFKASNNDHIVEVNINDDIDFVCPYNSDGDLYDDPDKHEFYIVYQVTKDEYDSCMLYTGPRKNNLVVNCSTPKQRKRFTIIFEPYSSIPFGQEYKAGEAYYFITTSTGYLGGLDNLHQGACFNHNMKLTIRVCCETTTLPTAQIPTTLPSNQSTNATRGLLPIHTRPPTIPSPHSAEATPTATTTLPTTTTTLTSTTSRRTTPSTRSRWKNPTTDKFPSTKHDGKKEEDDTDYHHENEVLPNKEQLVNAAPTTSSSYRSWCAHLLLTCSLLMGSTLVSLVATR